MKFNFPLIYLIITIFLMPVMLTAQRDSLLEIYNKEVISFGGNVFIKDGNKLKFKEVKTLLLKFPDSSTEFLMARKKSTLTSVLAIPGIILMGIYLSEANNSDSAYLYGLSGAGLIITASIFGGQSKNHMQNAVWLYNRD